MVYTDTSTHPNGLNIKPRMLNKVLSNDCIYYHNKIILMKLLLIEKFHKRSDISKYTAMVFVIASKYQDK